MNDRIDKVPKILNTSATLTGFVLSLSLSLKTSNRTAETIIDELPAFVMVMFMTSGVMYFLLD